MTDIQKNIRENQDSKKEREKNSRIVEIKAMCIGAALILAGGAAGGYALNEVKAEREKAQAEAREQAEREKAADDAGGKESRTDCGGKGRSKRGRLSG